MQTQPTGTDGSATLHPWLPPTGGTGADNPTRHDQKSPVTRILAIACAITLLAGCSQLRLQKCVRDMVNNNEPYLSQAERDDSESLARQMCRERAEARGN